MNPVILFGIGAALLGGKRKKRRRVSYSNTARARYAAELARRSGGTGTRVPVGATIGEAQSTMVSFRKYPSGGVTNLAAPKDGKTPVTTPDMDTILVPEGWWEDAQEEFLKAEGDRHERVAEVLKVAFGDIPQKAQDGKAFQALQADLLERAEAWVPREDTKKIEVEKPKVEIVERPVPSVEEVTSIFEEKAAEK